ncbi:MAG TPA: carbohydrate ABC transporter substrate-binding protein [Alphaproteobacteria bacterium]|nr:carbohydrate ABC transporter substrate-binding protein [Alphaproteobacteria bacterium]
MHTIQATIARTALAALAAAGLAALPGAAQAVDIKMWTLVTEGYPEFVEYAAAEFKKTHPDVNIIYENFPNEAYKTQIQVALTGSEPPDVFFNWAGEDAARLVRDGLVLDITGAPFEESLSEGWKSSFTYEGKRYGVPTDAVSKYFYYDIDYFAQHNLTPPTTFQGLLDLCRAVRAIDPNTVPWPLGNSERWKLNHVITMLNQRVLGSEATAADYALTAPDDQLYTNPGYVEAWQKVLDLKDAGCFQEAPNATSPEASRSMFAAQVSPFIYCGTWCANIFISEGFDNFAMFRFPAVEGGKGDPGGQFLVPQGLMVSAKTAHPKEAAEWASFLVSDEMAAKFAELLGAIPSNPALIDQVQGTEQYKWMVSDIAAATESVMVLDVLLEASVANAYLDAGVEILNGTKTPQQAMEDIRNVALAAKQKLGAS